MINSPGLKYFSYLDFATDHNLKFAQKDTCYRCNICSCEQEKSAVKISKLIDLFANERLRSKSFPCRLLMPQREEPLKYVLRILRPFVLPLFTLMHFSGTWAKYIRSAVRRTASLNSHAIPNKRVTYYRAAGKLLFRHSWKTYYFTFRCAPSDLTWHRVKTLNKKNLLYTIWKAGYLKFSK